MVERFLVASGEVDQLGDSRLVVEPLTARPIEFAGHRASGLYWGAWPLPSRPFAP